MVSARTVPSDNQTQIFFSTVTHERSQIHYVSTHIAAGTAHYRRNAHQLSISILLTLQNFVATQ